MKTNSGIKPINKEGWREIRQAGRQGFKARIDIERDKYDAED